MKLFSTIAFSLILSFSIQAQNYHLFPSLSDTGYFRVTTPNFSQLCTTCFFSNTFDSVKVHANYTEYFHERTYKGFSLNPVTNCVEILDTSWLGWKTDYYPNGDFHFFNKNGDTILIRTNIGLNVPWRFYTFPNGNHVDAEYYQQSVQPVLSITNPVRYYALQFKDSLGNPISHPLNAIPLSISQDYGFNLAPNFYDFPNYTQPVFFAGHNTFGGTLKNMTWKDIHDFAPNDEFHIQTRVQYAPDNWKDTLEIWRILEKNIGSNHFQYKVHREKVVARVDTSTAFYFTDTTYTIDTIWQTYSFYNYLDTWQPYVNQPCNDPIYCLYNYIYLSREDRYGINYNNRWIKSRRSNIYFSTDVNTGCTQVGLGGPLSDTNEDFIVGAGGPYYDGPISRRLVYYDKSADSWGNPFDFQYISVNVHAPALQQKQLTVFPNPSQNSFSISTGHQSIAGRLKIYNIMQQLVFDDNYVSNTNASVNIQDWASGVYIIRFEKDNEVYIGKLTKF